MAQVDPLPSDDELKKRRKLTPNKYIVDPTGVSLKDEQRVKNWAAEMIGKHEHKLNVHHFKNKQIVTSGVVEPEAVDIGSIYPFPDMRWMIFRDDRRIQRVRQVMWSIMLTTRQKNHERILFTTTFAKI